MQTCGALKDKPRVETTGSRVGGLVDSHGARGSRLGRERERVEVRVGLGRLVFGMTVVRDPCERGDVALYVNVPLGRLH